MVLKKLFHTEMTKMKNNLHLHLPTEAPLCSLRLDFLSLDGLKNLKCIGGANGGNNERSFNKTTSNTAFLDTFKISQADGVSWTLSQYPRKIYIRSCPALSNVIPCYAAGEMEKLRELKIFSCDGMKEVFETQWINKSVIMLKLANLNILEIVNCDVLEHIFTFSTLETLGQLERLSIINCKAMKVIVKEEEDASSSKALVFPCLKCIELDDLPELMGFFLGTNEFHWPSLDKAKISGCPRMKVFTAGRSIAPQLKYVESSLGKHNPEHGFNSHVTTTTTRQHQETQFPSLESRRSCSPAATSEKIIISSFLNLIIVDVGYNSSVKKIIPSNGLLQLQNLEKIKVNRCDFIEEVFEALEGRNSGFDESQTTIVKLPNLTQVKLDWLSTLRYIWKSNRWTLFEFPNLIRVDIFACNRLEHVFSSSMVGSLLQLQELHIIDCYHMEEVFAQDGNFVVEEESDDTMNEIVLPCLKSLKLERLSSLKGFWLGKEDFSFPLLDTLTIKQCPEMTTFTTGNSSTPELKEIQTNSGQHYVEKDINSLIKMNKETMMMSDDDDDENDDDYDDYFQG